MNGNGYMAVPGHAGLLVKMYVEEDQDGLVWLWYIGDADVLIAAGIATAADIFAPRKKTGPRPRPAGPESCHMDRYWAVRSGAPIRRRRVLLHRERENALRLPGALEALEAHEAA